MYTLQFNNHVADNPMKMDNRIWVGSFVTSVCFHAVFDDFLIWDPSFSFSLLLREKFGDFQFGPWIFYWDKTPQPEGDVANSLRFYVSEHVME